jgi:F-type H+-transporting ATPase subunit b
MDLDLTFVIQLAIFLTLLGGLTPVVLRPFQKVIDERENKTRGARAEASRLESLADQDRTAYQARIDEGRAAASRERDALRSSGRAQEREIISEARGEVLAVLGKSREEIEAAETTARASLDADQGVLATALVEKVLGRKVA